jgi:hypothetical protein
MLPMYRQVVRKLGAEFTSHTGKVGKGSCKLKSVVWGADVVVFITSIKSHGALKVAKNTCRRNGKRFLPLRETGVENLERVLRANAVGNGV